MEARAESVPSVIAVIDGLVNNSCSANICSSSVSKRPQPLASCLTFLGRTMLDSGAIRVYFLGMVGVRRADTSLSSSQLGVLEIERRDLSDDVPGVLKTDRNGLVNDDIKEVEGVVVECSNLSVGDASFEAPASFCARAPNSFRLRLDFE